MTEYKPHPRQLATVRFIMLNLGVGRVWEPPNMPLKILRISSSVFTIIRAGKAAVPNLYKIKATFKEAGLTLLDSRHDRPKANLN